MTKVLEALTPYYSDDTSVLYLCDTFKALECAARDSVDMIFADPPYFLSNGGISCSGGKQVSVNKGEWDVVPESPRPSRCEGGSYEGVYRGKGGRLRDETRIQP